jgi:hypothetical protein
MSVMMVRQNVKHGSIEEAEAAVRALFTTLDRVRPGGLRYASTRVMDSSTFVILVELADGTEDTRPAIPEYVHFQEPAQALGRRTAGDRAPRRGRVIQPVRHRARVRGSAGRSIWAGTSSADVTRRFP